MSREALLRILDLARWAPSGDNTQPWRFEIAGDDSVVVHGHDTRDHVIYDFDGHASHLAHGALLETMRIAGSAEGVAMDFDTEADAELRHLSYRVRFTPSPALAADPLLPFVTRRVVQRRPMRLRPLTEVQRQALAAAPGVGFRVQLFESLPDRLSVAGLLWDNAYIRLACPEAYPVHRQIIEWGARYSKDRIPEQAVGVDPATARLMRWVMESWPRVRFFNRYLMGTIVPRVQLDYLPALRCAAHLLVRAERTPSAIADWLALGQAVQRLWLTATATGLHLQPEMTPVIFRWYARAGRSFSAEPALAERAAKLTERFERMANARPDDFFGFFCRVGVSAEPASRSLRLDLSELIN